MKVCILKMVLIMIISYIGHCADVVCAPESVSVCAYEKDCRQSSGKHRFSLFNMQHAIYVPSLLWEGYAALVIISDLVVYLFPSNTSNCSGHPQLFKQRSVEDSLI